MEAMKIWTSVLCFEADVATHSIENALNTGFLNAEEEAVLSVELITTIVDNFKLRNLKNYNLRLLFHIQIERIF